MHTIFNNILVPVDFSTNTDLAIQKAIEIASEKNLLIHLFHVERTLTTFEAKLKLNLIKSEVEEKWPWVDVLIHLGHGASIPIDIVGISRLVDPQLIVIGKHGNGNHFPFFNIISPEYLTKMTNTPVLTVKPGCSAYKLKTIVIPVQDVVPERKLEIASMVAQRNKSQVHLVTTKKGVNSRAFVNTYRQLREVLGFQIEFFADGIHDLARATLSYAESVEADLVLVDTGKESTVSSLFGRKHLSRFLKQNSRTQILDVV